MTKTKRTNDAEALTVSATPKQAVALDEIGTALGDHDRARVAAKVLSVGLYVLGLDPTGDYALAEMTDALHGERSNEVFNELVDAGGTATDARRDVEVDERRRIYAKGEEARA